MEWCDIMIWQFPLWWLGMPAMMKGWVDRVFARRRTYGHSDYHSEGVFSGKRAMISTTTGVAEGAYRKDGPSGDISGLLRPVHHGVLKFTGYSVLAPHVVYSPIRMTEQERCDALNSFSERVIQLPDELPIDIP
jgi:NAD(P)H dehydrogenase (quinone)